MIFQMRPPSDMPSKTISDFTVKIDHKADMTVNAFGSKKRCLNIRTPLSYPIAKNNKIEKYKSKWSA